VPTPEKATLLEQLESERAELDRLLVEVGVDRMTDSIGGGWSVKDVVAHIMAYDRWWAAQLRSLIRGTPATTRELYDADDEPAYAAPSDLDTRNAAIRERYRDWPLDDVLQAAQSAFDSLHWTIDETPAALWDEPLAADWAAGERLQDLIRTQIIDHYREHVPELRSWIMQDEGLASGPDEPVEA
jgi:hypothetical protein